MQRLLPIALLASLFVLASCGKDNDVKKATHASPSVTPPAPRPEPVPVEVPFEERLSALEIHPEKCAAPQLKGLEKIDLELKTLYARELLAAKTLRDAENVDTSLSPVFARVQAVAQGCRFDKLFVTTPQEAVAELFLKEANGSCENLADPLVAHKIFTGRIQGSTRLALGKLLAACGTADPAANEAAFREAKLGALELQRQAAAKFPCSLDNVYLAEENETKLQDGYQAVASPRPAARLLALQLHLDLALGFKKIRASCEPGKQGEPPLALHALEDELAAFEAKQDRCAADASLAGLRARALEAERADAAKLQSEKFKRLVMDRYQALLTRIQLLEAGCGTEKENNLKLAKVHALKDRWAAFVGQEGYTEARLAESVAFAAEAAAAKAADQKLTLSPAGRAQVEKLYKDLDASLASWQAACRASLAAEKERKRLEEEKRKEEERKRLEEEKRKKAEEEKKRLEEEQRKKAEEEKRRLEEEKKKKEEAERQRLEEEKRKKEEAERKRLEEEKRKKEEAERKRLEEEKRKEEERKRLEEEKRRLEEEKKKKEEERKRIEEEKRKKAEEERKRLEEEKRKKAEEERKRLEEEKRKLEEERKRIEEEKRRKEEERKRAEQEKFKSVEEKRQKLTPPKWEQIRKPSHKAWTSAVLSVVRRRMADFDQARDADSFCPGYHKAELHERENCWLLLVSYIAFKESHYKLQSSFVEGNGVASIGFMALSEGECPNARSARELNDPVKNLTCGTNMMARLIAKDKMISDTDIGPDLIQRRQGRGAAAYWSTLKPKHKVYHKINKRWYTVGFKPLFQEWLRDYKKLRR